MKYIYCLISGLIAGIFWASFITFGSAFVVLAFLLFGIIFIVGWMFNNRLIWGIALMCLGLALGVWRFETSITPISPELESAIGERVVLAGKIITSPDYGDSTLRVVILLEDGETRVMVTLPVYTDVSYGDIVSVAGILQRPSDFLTDLGKEFSYEKYLLARHIRYQLVWASVEEHKRAEIFSVIGFLFGVKDNFISALSKMLPEPHSALAGGILLGVKDALGRDFEVDLRRTGIIHIVVLSGYNVTVVAVFIMFIMSFLPRKWALFFSGFGIVLFALLVGDGPTVVRSSIMALLALVALAFGRIYNVSLALLWAGVIMIIHSPMILVYDIGFQLSFIATLGLIYLVPLMDRFLFFLPSIFQVRELTATTLAAQVSVLPWLLYKVGELSLVSVMVNFLILPIVPLAMLLSFLAGVFFFIFYPLAFLLSLLAYGTLHYMVLVVLFFASVPFATLTFINTPLWLVFLFYGGLVYWVTIKSKDIKPYNMFGDR